MERDKLEQKLWDIRISRDSVEMLEVLAEFDRLKLKVAELEGKLWDAQDEPRQPAEGLVLGMNTKEATERACKEPTLLDALTFICIWESERVVKQARKNMTWETCFRVSLDSVLKTYPDELSLHDHGLRER